MTSENNAARMLVRMQAKVKSNSLKKHLRASFPLLGS